MGIAVVALIVFAPYGFSLLQRELATLTNTSYFRSEQVEEGRRLAREGRALVKGIHAYKSVRGRWPEKLEDMPAGLMPVGGPPREWIYYLKEPSFGLSRIGVLSYDLYYEPEAGWLMAENAVTRPIRLGHDP